MKAKGYIYGIALSVLILVLMAANLWFGSINIPAGAVWNTLTGNEVEKASWTFYHLGSPVCRKPSRLCYVVPHSQLRD